MTLDCVKVNSNLEEFLQNCQSYDHLDSSVAIISNKAELLYQNPAFKYFNKNLNYTCDNTKLRENITDAPEFKSLFDICINKSLYQCKNHTFYYGRNASVEISLVLKPVFIQESNKANAVMLSIAEENIHFNNKYFAHLQNDKSLLASRVKQLSVDNSKKNNLIRSLLRDTPFAIMLLNLDRQVIQTNRACEELLEKSSRQLMGQSCDQFFHCFKKKNKCPVIDDKSNINIQECAGIFLHEKKITLLRSAVILTQSSEPVILEAFIDISEKKQYEEELKNHQHSLEKIVVDRTRDLQISNRELDSYSSSIAHDLRGPLRSIVSFSQILAEDARNKLSDEDIDIISRITNSAKRMAHVIDSILNVSRVSRIKINPKIIDMTRLVKNSAGHVQNIRETRQIKWKIADNISALGDESLISQLVDNLIGNALKFTVDRNPTIIEFGTLDTDGETTYYIKDNGIGFNMKYTSKLFTPFFQLHTDSKFEGSGIGLATVQRIIDRHEGKIWAESEPDKGATFFFTLSS